ncbi:hypothetical protein B0H63DRAFT_3334 [Podospora didyma]|uniref:Uncharacterized protein n=1 Tax=Podospora didyma TaxID=330526 RepID=A0AAE0U6N2_9PEZI|nr:hypothetical protein B0H63DRAFT_3334 [Podospora didyma]
MLGFAYRESRDCDLRCWLWRGTLFLASPSAMARPPTIPPTPPTPRLGNRGLSTVAAVFDGSGARLNLAANSLRATSTLVLVLELPETELLLPGRMENMPLRTVGIELSLLRLERPVHDVHESLRDGGGGAAFSPIARRGTVTAPLPFHGVAAQICIVSSQRSTCRLTPLPMFPSVVLYQKGLILLFSCFSASSSPPPPLACLLPWFGAFSPPRGFEQGTARKTPRFAIVPGFIFPNP